VLAHATVIDATGAAAKPDVTVIVTGDRITEMGRSGEIHIPKDAQIVDATGKFLIPGLWDMHVHWEEKEYLSLFIANGVTGIRIMSGLPIHHQWRKEIGNGSLLGPRLVIASLIVDGPRPMFPDSIAVTNAAEARRVVVEVKQDGADFVKVLSFLQRDAYFAIADEAKKRGIPFEGHVPLSVSAEEASDAGQKSFEHLLGVLPACSSRSEELNKAAQADLAEEIATGQPMQLETGPHLRQTRQMMLDTYSAEKAAALFALLKRNGTWQCPTLAVNRVIAFADDSSFTNDPRLKYMPRHLRAWWPTVFHLTPEDFAYEKEEFAKEMEVVGAMQKSGVGILAGTDTLNPFCFPGFSLHDELGLLVKAGLTPMEALQAATLNPARFLGTEKDFGTVETGKIADLVLLDANPLEDIGSTKQISSVVYGGKLFPRASLDQMLTEVEALAARKSIAEALLQTIKEKDVDAAVKQYHQVKTNSAGCLRLRRE
jgi:imidazolonepropionase-like amidohydrolase